MIVTFSWVTDWWQPNDMKPAIPNDILLWNCDKGIITTFYDLSDSQIKCFPRLLDNWSFPLQPSRSLLFSSTETPTGHRGPAVRGTGQPTEFPLPPQPGRPGQQAELPFPPQSGQSSGQSGQVHSADQVPSTVAPVQWVETGRRVCQPRADCRVPPGGTTQSGVTAPAPPIILSFLTLQIIGEIVCKFQRISRLAKSADRFMFLVIGNTPGICILCKSLHQIKWILMGWGWLIMSCRHSKRNWETAIIFSLRCINYCAGRQKS